MVLACGRKDETQAAIERQMNDYPASTLLDIYKSFFQDNFGPGHIVSDTAAARAYIRRELAEATKYDAHYYEPAGRGDNFYRVSLALIADSLISFDDYFDAFYSSVKEVKSVDMEQWRDEWVGVVETIVKMKLSLPDFEKDAATLDSLLAAGQYAYHHSPDYNRRYHPHYRLMRRDIFEQRIKPVIDSSRVANL